MYMRKKTWLSCFHFHILCALLFTVTDKWEGQRQTLSTEPMTIFFNQDCFCSFCFITIEVILNICDWDIFIGLRTEHRYLCYLLRLSTLNAFKYDGLERINSLNTQQINNILSCSASEQSIWAQYRLVQSFVYVLYYGWLLFYLELT